MGSPDLPGNENDRRRQFQPPPSNELPMHGNEGLELPQDDIEMAENQQPPAAPALPTTNGDQNNDTDTDAHHNPYMAEGYHPLSFEPMAFDDNDGDESSDDDDDDDGESSMDEVAFDVRAENG